MSSKRKLKTLSLREKVEVINAVKSGAKRVDVAAQYGLPPSTLSMIIKNKAEILKKHESGCNLNSKRQRTVGFPDLEELLSTWLKQCRAENVSINGNILRKKAEDFSKSLGHATFRASNGWLEKFKKRHNLVFNKNLHGVIMTHSGPDPVSPPSLVEPEQSPDNSQESAEVNFHHQNGNRDPIEVVRVTSGDPVDHAIKVEDTDSNSSSSRRSSLRGRSRTRSGSSQREGRGRGRGPGGARQGSEPTPLWLRRLEERRLRTDTDMARSLRSIAASSAAQARSMRLMLELLNDMYETLQQQRPNT